MKPSLFLTALALLGPTAFAADADTKPNTAISGKATVTIDVNGKKETREVDLGNALQLTGVTTSIGPATVKSATATHPWLGVVTDEPSDDVRAQLPIPDGTGLLVSRVYADSPAAKGGLEKNDVLVRLDDQILTNTEQLGALIRTKKEGDIVHVAYLRKGREASAEAKLGSHADDEATGVTAVWNFDNLIGKSSNLIGKSITGEIQNALKPLVFQGEFLFDKDGQTLNRQRQADGDKAGSKANEQWSLFSGNVQADVSEQIKKLDKTLRDAGLNDETIAQTNKAVAEAVAQVQKALSNATAEKGEIQRNLEKALEEMKRAVDEARRAAEEAVRKAQPTPPAPAAPPAQKAP